MNGDITVEILKDIRQEIRGTNERLTGVNERLGRLEASHERLEASHGETNERLGRLEASHNRLEGTVREAQLRTATELTYVAQALDDVRELLRDRLDVRRDVNALEARVSRLEKHTGLE